MTEESIADASLRDAPDGESDAIRICATCNAVVENAEWHPVSARTTEAGEVAVYLFCSEACKAQWQTSHE